MAEPLEFRAPWPEPWCVDSVIETLEPMVLDRRRARLDEVLADRLQSVTLLLDELDDPHNRAAIIRSCDAFGVQQLHALQPSSEFEVHHGIAAGTERWIDLKYHAGPTVAVDYLRQRGFELVATHPEGELTPEELPQIGRVALVLGNEHRGIQPALAGAATRRVRVPMRGFVESLNVSVSAALLLMAATAGRRGDLSPGVRRQLYARALFRTVPQAARVLDALASSGRMEPGC